jgi:alkanesulfonate monooxygenase SsuD/methylene tetrahydromethanopterin reductase-like flavin-dependent oxidoreductase (luciferase family)
VENYALSGAPPQVREKVREFIAAGIDELTIIPCGSSRREVIETFAREVITKF